MSLAIQQSEYEERTAAALAGSLIFDRAGIWVSTLHVGVDLTPANLEHDIRIALRSRSR